MAGTKADAKAILMDCLAVGVEILRKIKQMDGAIKIWLLFRALILLRKEPAWIRIIAGGSILIGIIQAQEEAAALLEVLGAVEEEPIQAF